MLASQLSIYKDTYQLVKTVTVYVNKMPRLYKFTLGEINNKNNQKWKY